jgi:hypothetical protein
MVRYRTIALQTDGNILVGGPFMSFNGTRRVGIARLLSYGVARHLVHGLGL